MGLEAFCPVLNRTILWKVKMLVLNMNKQKVRRKMKMKLAVAMRIKNELPGAVLGLLNVCLHDHCLLAYFVAKKGE
jgi:hypothetical protein